MLPALNFGGHLLNNGTVLFQTAAETQCPPHPCSTTRTMLVHSLTYVTIFLMPHPLTAMCHFSLLFLFLFYLNIWKTIQREISDLTDLS